MMGNVPYLSLRQDPLSRMENKLPKRTFDIVFTVILMHFIPNHINYCNNHYKINHAGTNLLPSKT